MYYMLYITSHLARLKADKYCHNGNHSEPNYFEKRTYYIIGTIFAPITYYLLGLRVGGMPIKKPQP